jgi:hypothetical protein
MNQKRQGQAIMGTMHRGTSFDRSRNCLTHTNKIRAEPTFPA